MILPSFKVTVDAELATLTPYGKEIEEALYVHRVKSTDKDRPMPEEFFDCKRQVSISGNYLHLNLIKDDFEPNHFLKFKIDTPLKVWLNHCQRTKHGENGTKPESITVWFDVLHQIVTVIDGKVNGIKMKLYVVDSDKRYKEVFIPWKFSFCVGRYEINEAVPNETEHPFVWGVTQHLMDELDNELTIWARAETDNLQLLPYQYNDHAPFRDMLAIYAYDDKLKQWYKDFQADIAVKPIIIELNRLERTATLVKEDL